MKEKKNKINKDDIAQLVLKLMQERLIMRVERSKLNQERRELSRRLSNLGRDIAQIDNEVDRHVADNY